MALAFDHWEVVLHCLDQGGNPSNPSYDLQGFDETDDYASIEAVADTLVTRFVAVSDLSVRSRSVVAKYTDAGAGFGTAEAENVALIVADLEDPGIDTPTANLRIPGPKATIFKGSAGKDWNTVDTADAAIIAYLSSFETGGLAFVSDGRTIKDSATSGNWYGKRVHRGSRRG